MKNLEKEYTVSFQTSNGFVSYKYYSEKNEIIDVMYNGVYQCTAKNGKRLINKITGTQQYNSISRQVEGI